MILILHHRFRLAVEHLVEATRELLRNASLSRAREREASQRTETEIFLDIRHLPKISAYSGSIYGCRLAINALIGMLSRRIVLR